MSARDVIQTKDANGRDVWAVMQGQRMLNFFHDKTSALIAAATTRRGDAS